MLTRRESVSNGKDVCIRSNLDAGFETGNLRDTARGKTAQRMAWSGLRAIRSRRTRVDRLIRGRSIRSLELES